MKKIALLLIFSGSIVFHGFGMKEEEKLIGFTEKVPIEVRTFEIIKNFYLQSDNAKDFFTILSKYAFQNKELHALFKKYKFLLMSDDIEKLNTVVFENGSTYFLKQDAIVTALLTNKEGLVSLLLETAKGFIAILNEPIFPRPLIPDIYDAWQPNCIKGISEETIIKSFKKSPDLLLKLIDKNWQQLLEKILKIEKIRTNYINKEMQVQHRMAFYPITPLNYACIEGKFEIVKILVKNGSVVNKICKTYDFTSITTLILTLNEIFKNITTAFPGIDYNNYLKIIKFLLKQPGINVRVRAEEKEKPGILFTPLEMKTASDWTKKLISVEKNTQKLYELRKILAIIEEKEREEEEEEKEKK